MLTVLFSCKVAAMMQGLAVPTLVLLLGSADAFLSKVTSFGPNGCVSVSKSKQGTCEITTNCDGQDTTEFEFAFVCVAGSKATKHSFGVGSFEDAEEYDTGVSCEDCIQPVPPNAATAAAAMQGNADGKAVVLARKAAPAARSAVATGKSVQRQLVPKVTGSSASPPDEKATYGPANCVSTWRSNESGTCFMQTDCAANVDISQYDFGLLCVGEDHALTRQLFGKQSFSHSETFDTLIKCKHCLAEDDPAGHTGQPVVHPVVQHPTNAPVVQHPANAPVVQHPPVAPGSLKQELNDIKQDIVAFSNQIAILNAKVFTPAPPVVLAAPTVKPASLAATVRRVLAKRSPVVELSPALPPIPVVATIRQTKVRTAERIEAKKATAVTTLDSRDSEIALLRQELVKEREVRKQLAATISRVEAKSTMLAKQTPPFMVPAATKAALSPEKKVAQPLIKVQAKAKEVRPPIVKVEAPVKTKPFAVKVETSPVGAQSSGMVSTQADSSPSAATSTEQQDQQADGQDDDSNGTGGGYDEENDN